jgi:hypothetical protein
MHLAFMVNFCCTLWLHEVRVVLFCRGLYVPFKCNIHEIQLFKFEELHGLVIDSYHSHFVLPSNRRVDYSKEYFGL